MDKEATLDAVESSLDVIEETVDTVKRVSPSRFNLNGTTKGQQIAILAGAAAIGALAGGGLTYILTKKRLTLKFEEIANREVEEAKQFYKNLHKEDDNKSLTPQQILEERHGKGAVDALRTYQGVAVEGPVPTEEDLMVDKEESAAYLEQVEGRTIEQAHIHSISVDKEANAFGEKIEVVERNVFADPRDAPEPGMEGWDYATELARRSGDKPYIISHDEYFEGELDYEQVQVTYYEGDDVLVDDQDVPIPDSDASVGDDNLTKFGHGSKDENIVYIRNDGRGLDYEVVRSEGKYAYEVLGFENDDELKHSHRPGVRKFRGYDD